MHNNKIFMNLNGRRLTEEERGTRYYRDGARCYRAVTGIPVLHRR